MKKHTMSIFSGKGDTAVAEWDPAVATETEHARGVFDAAIHDGFAAVKPTSEGAVAVGDKFDPSAEEIVLLRPIAGG